MTGKLIKWSIGIAAVAFAVVLVYDREPEESTDPITSGRWRPARPGTPESDGPNAEMQGALDELNNLGYAGGVRAAPSVLSVTVHDERAEPGLNFYTSGHAAEAILMDMDGAVVHGWNHDYDVLWPSLEVPPTAEGRGKWRRAYLYPNGDLLAIHEGIGMIKLDRDSKLLWEYPGRTHHDMDVLPDGTIWTLAREATVIPRVNPDVPSMDDFIVELDANGRELRRVSVLGCVERGRRPDLLERMVRERDLFHTNSIEVLDGSLADRIPEFAAGNVLISMRHLDAIAVVDVDTREVVWALTGAFRFQHDPTVLENGNLLLFDNRGQGEASTIYELDPVTGETAWMYRGTQENPFFSKACGTSYRLPGGNTLITESDGGRAIEVTADKTIVWEFYNPRRAGQENEFIACIFDLQRIPRAKLGAWVEDDSR